MDPVFVILVILAAVAAVAGWLTGRARRQGPRPQFNGGHHSGDREDPPVEPGDAAPGDPSDHG